MKRHNLTFLLLLLLMMPGAGAAAGTVSLDSCRSMAVANNKALRMAGMQREAAHYNRKSAFTAYLPKVSATGVYMHMSKELSLLSDEQKASLSHLGDALSVPELNGVGQGLTEALRTDTRNMAGVAVVLTQPLYTGGKIRTYNNIAGMAERIAADKYDLQYQELIVSVDETYWSIVELAARKRLAESYLELVKTLENDITQMAAEGFATQADVLSVRVKVNEAEVAIIQVDNGIEILKMKMCQLCGLPLDQPIELKDETEENFEEPDTDTAESLYTDVRPDRPELRALGTAVRIHEEKVKVARAEFLPSVALTGGYMASYPSVFNSFEKKFKGMWNIGVAVNVPILTWGDRRNKVNAARAEAVIAALDYEETGEKIELQVSQCRQKLREARQRHTASVSSRESADENLRYATLGLREGVIPVSNVIEAQTAWLKARTGLISSEIELRLANVYLRKSLGLIK